MYCSGCGTRNPDDASFCSGCGESLRGPSVSTVVRPPRWRVLILTLLPSVVALALGGYLIHVQFIQMPAERYSIHDNAIATQQGADAYLVMDLAKASEQAGRQTAAAALWVAGEGLANRAADAWERAGNSSAAKVLRDAAVSHVTPSSGGSPR